MLQQWFIRIWWYFQTKGGFAPGQVFHTVTKHEHTTMPHALLYVTVKRLFWGGIFSKAMRNFHKRTRRVNKSVHSNKNESEFLKNLSSTWFTSWFWWFYKYPFVWFLFFFPGISKVTPAIHDSNRGPLRSPDPLSLKHDVFLFEVKPPHVEFRKSLKRGIFRHSGFSSCCLAAAHSTRRSRFRRPGSCCSGTTQSVCGCTGSRVFACWQMSPLTWGWTFVCVTSEQTYVETHGCERSCDQRRCLVTFNAPGCELIT